ncbi:YbgA family protein [Herbidospora sp. RD11066]
MRPRIGVSSCLIGEPVRFNGGHSRDRFLAGELDGHVDWVPFCPEVEAGLGTPRETLRLEEGEHGERLMLRKSRVDLTATMREVTDRRIATLEVDGYVFKSKSPSCGIHGIPVYDANDHPARRTRGVFAQKIIETYPLLPAEDEGRLNDAVLREQFVERIFAHARLRELFTDDWKPRDLVGFHSRHKMQLLAHDPEGYRVAGRVVSRAGSAPREELERDYTVAFQSIMSRKSTIGRNVNALHHCLGMVGHALDDARRADLVEVIDAYQGHQVAIAVPMTLLLHHAKGEAAEYVQDQTFFAPFPADLRLRNHVPN